ncbi:MarR family transcriptional regulator [Robbsia andropogonis]|uniref:MarR family transcriptional regulator n=1 Tax=Robbsia andropogonis TaxID=28092 RepID=A0A0F5K3F5_9BURK|nr:MarR family transcriptional regulator [Robbsia andropogonis]KKB64646.1 MarR family transcriptional regulator [Robbsia andropogonis]MCP1117819.1 MarR family transcriptional regulator [Robbsia andropogonis]MCP1127284.1 MarR family transcriptional regulator [Robbsia andropogonis]
MSKEKTAPRTGGDWIGYNLKITQHRLRQRLDAELGQLGITAPQNAVLLAVANNPRISNAELARAAFVTPQTMQAILVNLERGGLIVRSPHPEHGRVIMSELTTNGKRAVADGAKAADAVERQMLSGLSAEEAQILCDLLKRCAAALADAPSS